MNRIAIYTLTRDRLPYTKRMFKQLKKTAGIEYDHYVIDNGSKDGTARWLMNNQDKYNIKGLILFGDNKGLWKSIQEMIDYTHRFEGYDYVLKLDNDFEFKDKGWLKSLIDVYKQRGYDVLSPFVEGVCDGRGGIERIVDDNGIGMVGHVGGGCLLTTPEFYDEDLPNGYMATGWDFWFCQGLKCGIVEDIHVIHDSKKMEKEYVWYHKRQVEEQKKKYGE